MTESCIATCSRRPLPVRARSNRALAGGEGRHYVGGKQAQRAHALLARQSPPGERTDHVVAATLRCDALHLSAYPVRRPEDDALMLDRRLPREQAVDAVVAVLVP